jgi:hemerythrin-like domain-containing protein
MTWRLARKELPMKPIAPLMIEHRLIERMIRLIEMKREEMEEHGELDTDFVDGAIDFVRIYADRTHHGKEEDILFRDLDKKKLSGTDRRLMDELVEEHRYGRRLVADLVEAKTGYMRGEKNSLGIVFEKLKALADFYPEHIRKEDKTFFPDAMGYLNEQEQKDMLHECWDFDRRMIHEQYESFVEKWEKDTKNG